jgi:hypothetical protein
MDMLSLIQGESRGVFEDAEDNPELPAGAAPPTWAASARARAAAAEGRRLKLTAQAAHAQAQAQAQAQARAASPSGGAAGGGDAAAATGLVEAAAAFEEAIEAGHPGPVGLHIR